MKNAFVAALCMVAVASADLTENLTKFIIDAAAAKNTRTVEKS